MNMNLSINLCPLLDINENETKFIYP